MPSSDWVGLIAPGSTRANTNFATFCDADPSFPPLFAAACETGLDNSPLYDNASFVKSRNMMDQVDVGMSTLHAHDGIALVRVAKIVNRSDVVVSLQERPNHARTNIHKILWNAEEGIFMNKQWTTGKWLPRGGNGAYPLAPTSFYPLLLGNLTVDVVESMIERYKTNSSEFAVNAETRYGMPSISRSASAFQDMWYWRGRAWGPMNFLVYLGLRQYDSSLARQARIDLVTQSEATFLVEWMLHHRVMENSDSRTGTGCGSQASPFYHWGALNALIPIMEG